MSKLTACALPVNTGNQTISSTAIIFLTRAHIGGAWRKSTRVSIINHKIKLITLSALARHKLARAGRTVEIYLKFNYLCNYFARRVGRSVVPSTCSVAVPNPERIVRSAEMVPVNCCLLTAKTPVAFITLVFIFNGRNR